MFNFDFNEKKKKKDFLNYGREKKLCRKFFLVIKYYNRNLRIIYLIIKVIKIKALQCHVEFS